jgi:hypothetical protein
VEGVICTGRRRSCEHCAHMRQRVPYTSRRAIAIVHVCCFTFGVCCYAERLEAESSSDCISCSTRNLQGLGQKLLQGSWSPHDTHRPQGCHTNFARASCRHDAAAVILHLLGIEGSQQASASLLTGAARPLRHLKSLHAWPDW